MIIGITGGSGSGKTTLLSILEQRGALVLDCDRIYHSLLSTDSRLLQAIEARFPGTVEGGVLQRKKLGSMVFSDPQALSDLNAITHPAITDAVLCKLTPAPPLAVIDASILLESPLRSLCDITVGVIAPLEQRIARLRERDGISREYALMRIESQPEDGWYREKCDYILENNGNLDAFHSQCLAFFQELGIMEA